ncbi:MAG: restriction endonuclease [Candidatus Micrarchaeaceae archaeon]
MAMPTWEQLLLPLLEFSSDKKEHSNDEAVESLATKFNLTPEERSEKLQRGQFKFANRVGWAKLSLTRAGLLEMPRRAYMKITKEGIALLDSKIKDLNDEELYKNYPIYAKWKDEMYNRHKERAKIKVKTTETKIEEHTPQERIDEEYKLLRNNLAEDLLLRLEKVTPTEFEKIVLELLSSLGYGNYLTERVEHTGQPGDEGIDGIIKQDKLGLDNVYIQAKRWKGIVGRPEIHKFVGALEGRRASKGVFITTSDFSKDAREYVRSVGVKVILINGKELADLMIDSDVGVSTLADYKIKRLDEDYFSATD